MQERRENEKRAATGKIRVDITIASELMILNETNKEGAFQL